MFPDRHLDIEKNIQINWSYQYRYSAIISRSKIVLTVLFCLLRIHLIYILRESIAIQTVLIKHYNHTMSFWGLLKTKETFFIMCFYQTSAFYIFEIQIDFSSMLFEQLSHVYPDLKCMHPYFVQMYVYIMKIS